MRDFNKNIPTTEFPGNTHLQVSVYYSKGGMNYFNGQNQPRGFYVSVKPVTINGNMVSYEIFKGYSQFLFAVNRYSEKQLERAIEESKPIAEQIIEKLKSERKAS